jgi:hypothetical protein
MDNRYEDGSAGDVNYGVIGKNYSCYRQPDPRIADFINNALGNAKKILNVGAGTGSYEPLDKEVTAVEPSQTMRNQRPDHLAEAIDAVAEDLPFPDNSFDASMTTFSVHQWTCLNSGLKEMKRVTSGPILILSCDPGLVQEFWLNDYAPKVLEAEAKRYPDFDNMCDILGGTGRVLSVPIPLDCSDGFIEAYYGRPEKFLNEKARHSCSAWSTVDSETSKKYVNHLQNDLQSDAWDQKYGNLRSLPEFDGSLRLYVSE